MENKLNRAIVEQYAQRVSTKLLLDRYSTISVLGGRELVTFSEIEQINYFILKNIFLLWKEESEKLKMEGLFDYHHEEVRAATTAYMNVLSNHILVSKERLTPLLQKSIEETIFLTLSPHQYFFQYFFESDTSEKISMEDLKSKIKYIKLHKSIFDALLLKLESYRIQHFAKIEIQNYFNELYFSFQIKTEEVEAVLSRLNTLSQVPTEELLRGQAYSAPSEPNPVKLYEKHAEKQIKIASKSNLYKPLKISLNQRIMFLKNLFDNDEEMLRNTLARIEACSSHEHALEILDYYRWDKEDDVVAEFYDIVRIKFKSLL